MRLFFPQCPLDCDRRKTSVKRNFSFVLFCLSVCFSTLFFLPFLTLLCNAAASQSFHIFGSTTAGTGGVLSNDRVMPVNFISFSATYIFTNLRRFRKVTEELNKNVHIWLLWEWRKSLTRPQLLSCTYWQKKKLKEKLRLWGCRIFHKLKKEELPELPHNFFKLFICIAPKHPAYFF